MKKKILFLIASLFAVVISANAQVWPGQSNSGAAKTSVTNVDTIIFSHLAADYAATVSVQLDVTQVSGTIAGKAYLQGSVNGVNYVTIDTTAFAAGAVYTKIWTYTSEPYVFYRVIGYSTGTVSANVAVYGAFRRPPTSFISGY